jgi:hypothetical protein
MRRVIPVLLAVAAVTGACSRTPRLDTRTFDLQNIRGGEAATMIAPYVYTDRAGAPGQMSNTDQTLTVRETPDNLDKIARVLKEYDQPKPWVRLHFQIIEADGTTRTDTAIAPVEAQLRKLFRFQGYKLLAEASIGGTEHNNITQYVGDSSSPFRIRVSIEQIQSHRDSGTVLLHVQLQDITGGAELETAVNARTNQTVVIGNLQSRRRERGTVILTVRPEFVMN